MKLQRAPMMNSHSTERKGTSQGAYRVVDTPFLVLKDPGGWFIFSTIARELRTHDAWMEHNGLGGRFPTRAQALDALQMALAENPISPVEEQR